MYFTNRLVFFGNMDVYVLPVIRYCIHIVVADKLITLRIARLDKNIITLYVDNVVSPCIFPTALFSSETGKTWVSM